MITVKTEARPNVRVELDWDAEGKAVAWIDLKPWSTLGHGGGQRMAVSALAAGEDIGTAMVGYTIALARWGAVGWEGIFPALTEEQQRAVDAGGKEPDLEPLPCTPDNVQALLEQNKAVYLLVDRQYAEPALAEESEKNASALQPGGTSRGDSPVNPTGALGSEAATIAARAKRPARRAPSKRPPR